MVTTQQEPARLSREEAWDRMSSVPEWNKTNGSIAREFTFGTFAESIEFVNKVARVASRMNHHPDIFISYTKVRLELSTHKVGGLSEKDFQLAAAVDGLARSSKPERQSK